MVYLVQNFKVCCDQTFCNLPHMKLKSFNETCVRFILTKVFIFDSIRKLYLWVSI